MNKLFDKLIICGLIILSFIYNYCVWISNNSFRGKIALSLILLFFLVPVIIHFFILKTGDFDYMMKEKEDEEKEE